MCWDVCREIDVFVCVSVCGKTDVFVCVRVVWILVCLYLWGGGGGKEIDVFVCVHVCGD